MDIRRWPIDQIMQLPEDCLGRRYTVTCTVRLPADTRAWDISELALPDRTIIHEFFIVGLGAWGTEAECRLAIGDQLPTTYPGMSRLEPLFAGLGDQGPDPRLIPVAAGTNIHLTRLKMYLPAQGRRLILEGTTKVGITLAIMAGIVVSTVPTEVTDWLISGQGRGQ